MRGPVAISGGVACAILGADVRLGLDDHAGALAVDERAADQPARDVRGFLREERLLESHPIRCARFVAAITGVTLASAASASSSAPAVAR